MERQADEIDALISDLAAQEEELARDADGVREWAQDAECTGDSWQEKDLVHSVTADPLDDCWVGGVDGGLVRKALHGTDIMLVRAAAALFHYRNGVLADNAYVPQMQQRPALHYSAGTLDRNASKRLATLHRLQTEVGLARDIAERVDLLLLDGALLPQYPDKPAEDSGRYEQYESVIDTYRELYSTVTEEDTALAGIVEDTRSSSLCRRVADEGCTVDALERVRDSHFLQYLLEKGERTALMAYAPNKERHPILPDLAEHGEAMYTFYLKTVERDRPVRIDMYAPENPVAVAEQTASRLYALSGALESYGLPGVIIEADRRAKIEQHDVDLVMQRLQARLAHHSGVEDLRRNRRPF